MKKSSIFFAITLFFVIASGQFTAFGETSSPSFEKHGYRVSKWGSGWEVSTVSGPSRMIFLSGVGAEDENSTGPTIIHLGDPLGQCRYAEDKIKRQLAREGATMNDIVKVIVYTTDVRYQDAIGKCEKEAFGEQPRQSVHTFVVLSQLAHPGMLLEIDVIAMTAAKFASPAFERKGYNYSQWTKGLLSEAMTVSGPRKIIFLSGVGAEDENSTGPAILHLGDFLGQCNYAEDKIKRLLAREGATLGDIVKTVVYVTDIRSESDLSKCEADAFGDTPRPVHTFLNINQLAHPGMLVEIDVTAMVN